MDLKAVAFLLLTTFSPVVPAMASTPPEPIRIDQENFNKLDPAAQVRVLEVVGRMEELANMDRSGMDHAERKALRSEVRDLRREAQAINAGSGTVIYISATTIIIILLLIILLR
jgi:hypothetical protein